jgi:cation diffusion facilitator family transporter
MTGLLLRLFVKNYKNTEDPVVHFAIGSFAGSVGIFCNALLFLLKLIAGWLSGSVSVIADALNNLMDASASIVTLLGFRIARKPADKTHPYGHARYEYLAGLAVAMTMLFVSLELASSSLEKVFRPTAVDFSAVTLIILLCSIAVKLWMAAFNTNLSQRIASTALKAAAADSLNDVLASSAILAGCLTEYFFHMHIDGWAGLLVSALIFRTGCLTARDAVSLLIGKQADEEFIRILQERILSHADILGIHDLLIHDYGPGQCFASVHVELSAEVDPIQCHEMLDHIEREVLEELNVHLVIHFDPVSSRDPELSDLHRMLTEILAGIHPELSLHDLRITHSAEGDTLRFDLSLPYALTPQQEDIRARIHEALSACGKEYIIMIDFDGE